MKKTLVLLLCIISLSGMNIGLVSPNLHAQSRPDINRPGGRSGSNSFNSHGSNSDENTSKANTPQKVWAWTAENPIGLHNTAEVDTLFENYANRFVPTLISDVWAATGNYGAEGTNRIWMEREPSGGFFLSDALTHWLPSQKTMKFYNSRLPITLLSYNFGGGRETAQERLKGNFSGNINKEAQVGALLDYIYSKGSYANQAMKNLVWGFNGSYMGPRYEFQGFYNHWNSLNKENGGITDPRYITDPAEMQAGVSSINPKAIPTNLTAAHTRVVGGQLWLNNRYKVGYWHEETKEGDTAVTRTYIPVISFIWTLDYSFNKHLFLNAAPGEATNFFKNTYFDDGGTRDVTSYGVLSNTLGISMLEGFHKYAKFGLAAYVTHKYWHYRQTPDSLDHTLPTVLSPLPELYGDMRNVKNQNMLYAGAQITKQKGSHLRYAATGQIGVAGVAAGDVMATGNINLNIPLKTDSLQFSAFTSFNNQHPEWLLNQYRSNHFIWLNDFGKTRDLKFGGELTLPLTKTRLRVELENIQNHIYLGNDCLPVQHSGSIQVLSARLMQSLKFKALHWDNRLTYQTSSKQEVISLPTLAWYSNLYLLFRIATLHVQLGVDCDYYTRYYAPGYQPALASFHTQNVEKVGNYPFMNLYANFKLQRARFYVMCSHVNQGIFGHDYFALPLYPMNPRRFQLGISVDLTN